MEQNLIQYFYFPLNKPGQLVKFNIFLVENIEHFTKIMKN